MPQHTEHPERKLLHEVHQRKLENVAVATNPLAASLGMRIGSVPALGQVILTFGIDEGFTQGGGVVQGGIFAAMLDFGLAFAALSATPADRSVCTIGLNVNYLRPALPGRFTVEALLEKMGRTVAVARASLYNAEGQLLATASSPLAVVPYPAARASRSLGAAQSTKLRTREESSRECG